MRRPAMSTQRQARRPRQQGRTTRLPGRGYGRTFDLLAVLAEERQGIPALVLERRLGIPRSTLSLMLQHFLSRGWVSIADDSRSLVIGPELMRLAFSIVSSFDIRRIARPHLEQLAEETREDIYLGIRHGVHMMCIDRVEGVEPVRLNVELGTLRPLHSTALGKLILALSPAELLDTAVRTTGLSRVTANTITDRARLERELEQIRKQGFAVNDGENTEGIYTIAVPIIGHDRNVVGIALPTLRPRALQNRDWFIPKMLEAARRINRAVAAQAGASRGALRSPPLTAAGVAPAVRRAP